MHTSNSGQLSFDIYKLYSWNTIRRWANMQASINFALLSWWQTAEFSAWKHLERRWMRILEEKDKTGTNTVPNAKADWQLDFSLQSRRHAVLTFNCCSYLCLCTTGPMRLSSWRATLPGPLVCLWPTWWKALLRTCTRCTLCPHWSRWGDWKQAIHFAVWQNLHDEIHRII